MPPVFQKWPLRVPLGRPKVALQHPKVPQRAPTSPPGDPPGAFGGAIGRPKVPLRHPQEHLRPPKWDKHKHKFYCSKTYISAQGRARFNRWNAFGMLLCPFFSSSASSRFFFAVCGRRGLPSPRRCPSWLPTGFPQGPPRPPLGGKMYHFM